MEYILENGIVSVLFLQGLGVWLKPVMTFFTTLGNEEFFLLVTPVIYWCIDARLGLRLGLFLMVGDGLNNTLKILFHGPRPYWYSTRVRALGSESSFGNPSGHAQNAVVFWGTLAYAFHRRWKWAVAILLIFLIGLSRVYLGVHFPHDVLVGWLVGAGILWGLMALEKPVRSWLERSSSAIKILAPLALSLVLILAGWLSRSVIGEESVLPEWRINSAAALPDAEPIDPLSISGLVSSAGTFFGLALGAAWLDAGGWYNARGTWKQLVLRYLMGIAGTVVFWFGLRAVFPTGESFFALSLRYVRYTLTGTWVSGLAPLLFIRLGLASKAR
jgi:membrane-associated phospholipid phosphatase